jgi:hypothetical protein
MRNARIDAPQVIQTAPQLIASIHLCVPWDDMRKVMGPGLSELKAAVAAQGIAPTGPGSIITFGGEQTPLTLKSAYPSRHG